MYVSYIYRYIQCVYIYIYVIESRKINSSWYVQCLTLYRMYGFMTELTLIVSNYYDFMMSLGVLSASRDVPCTLRRLHRAASVAKRQRISHERGIESYWVNVKVIGQIDLQISQQELQYEQHKLIEMSHAVQVHMTHAPKQVCWVHGEIPRWCWKEEPLLSPCNLTCCA